MSFSWGGHKVLPAAVLLHLFLRGFASSSCFLVITSPPASHLESHSVHLWFSVRKWVDGVRVVSSCNKAVAPQNNIFREGGRFDHGKCSLPPINRNLIFNPLTLLKIRPHRELKTSYRWAALVRGLLEN